MSEIHPIEVPKWGMTMEEGTIGEWQVAEGEAFSKGAPLCTIESSKISNELEAPFDGFLRRIVAGIGDTLPVGALIAVSADPSVPDSEVDAFIAAHTPAGSAPAAPAPAGTCATDEGGSATCATSGPAPTPSVGAGQGGATQGSAAQGSAAQATEVQGGADTGDVLVPESLRGSTGDSVFATPHARAFAEGHGIDLGAVTGTGRAGRISLADVESAVTAAGGRVPARVPARRSEGPARSGEEDTAVPATPVARRLAGELGINLHDCRTTGTRGRVCRLDVEEAARRFGIALPGEAAPPSSALPPSTPSGRGAAVPAHPTTGGRAPGPVPAPEAVPFSPMRRTIGSRLQASYQTSPHFRVRQEIVLDELLALRRSINAAVPEVRISVNDLVVKAAGLALVRVPEVNVQFDEASQSVLRFPHADVAVAVAVPDGLITPIVRSVDTRSLSEVSGDLAGLITRAKAGRLTPDEFQGGTFTVSNLGMFGVTGFDAIINPPQAAILAVGAGLPRPVVDGDGSVVVRTVMEVTLSGDHRVIDGATGASFVGELKAILESPTQMLV